MTCFYHVLVLNHPGGIEEDIHKGMLREECSEVGHSLNLFSWKLSRYLPIP